MSEETQAPAPPAQPNSLLGNLTNKIKYNLHKATYDPAANQFAEQQIKEEQKDATKTDKVNTTEDQGDPNKFSATRVVKKIGSDTWSKIQRGFIPFLSLMLAMIIANSMIVYPFPVRIIFFILTLVLCNLSSFIAILLALFFILKWLYSRTKTGPAREIMPTIFALLPITTYVPDTTFKKIVLYMFNYPKTPQGAEKLTTIMKDYSEDLKSSFAGLDRVKNLPLFANSIKQINDNLSTMHEPSYPVEQNENINETKEEEAAETS